MRALVVIFAVACAPAQGTEPVRTLDETDYLDVHAVLEARCGTLDCHGDAGRALRLYAETGLRAADELRGQPITTAELAANVRSIAALDDDLLLGKPLAGELHHVGGDIWLEPDEAQIECFASWLAGTLDAAACAEAATQIGIAPPMP